MSILLREQIREEYEVGRIVIKPYDSRKLGPNSYDVSLSDELATYNLKSKFSPRNHYLDVRGNNQTTSFKIPKEGYKLMPGILYLGCTVEAIGSDYYIPMYEGRSSMARLGIQTHISAGFGDVGFKAQWTLEIIVTHPVMIYPNMSIGQIYFNKIDNEYNFPQYRYNGKYATQVGPTSSRSYLDPTVPTSPRDDNIFKFLATPPQSPHFQRKKTPIVIKPVSLKESETLESLSFIFETTSETTPKVVSEANPETTSDTTFDTITDQEESSTPENKL